MDQPDIGTSWTHRRHVLAACRLIGRGREDGGIAGGREDGHPGGPGPDFLSGIDDFAIDEDMAKLMRGVYVVFQSEVGGAECKAGAGKLMDLMSKLDAEAQGNTPVADLRTSA